MKLLLMIIVAMLFSFSVVTFFCEEGATVSEGDKLAEVAIPGADDAKK